MLLPLSVILILSTSIRSLRVPPRPSFFLRDLAAKSGSESTHDDCSVAPSTLSSTKMARFERRGLVSLMRS